MLAYENCRQDVYTLIEQSVTLMMEITGKVRACIPEGLSLT